MKKFKNTLILCTAIMLFANSSTFSLASTTYKTNAEIVSEITGEDLDTIISKHFETGKSYGTIAKEAGFLDEFKSIIFEQKKLKLNEDIANGIITQEQGDEILQTIEQNQLICDGSGNLGNCGLELGYGNRNSGRSCGLGYGRCGNRGFGKGYNRNR